MDALKGLEKPMLTFGLERGDIHTSNLTYEKGVGSFDLIYRGENLGRITLQVPGSTTCATPWPPPGPPSS